MYCLAMAIPGSAHYGYFFISYEFVYVGNRHGVYICIYKTLSLSFGYLIVDLFFCLYFFQSEIRW